MEVVETIEDVRRLVSQARLVGRGIGFVPTMGALHEGHYSLIDAARARGLFVVVSIFVNPTQFGPNEDYAAYPRTTESDLSGCRAHGSAVVFMPTAEVMYPPGRVTEVCVPSLSGALCGASRPGHFTGVCTVVSKLFNIVAPDAAFFGAKDYQQATIIRRMTADLNFPIEIVVCPTVREADGLAMSSRNRYLSAGERAQAVCLSEALALAGDLIRRSHPPAGQVKAAMREHIERRAPLGRVDYINIVDPDTLRDVETTDRAVQAALAVQFGRARLIDNARLEP